MSWAAALILGLVTGILGCKSVHYYYSLRYRLKTEARGVAGFGVDLIGLVWILLLAYTPSFALHYTFNKDDIFERSLAFLIFVVFIAAGYISFKKSNPEAFKVLFGSEED